MDNIFISKVKGNNRCVELAKLLEKYRLQYILVKTDEFLPDNVRDEALANINKALFDTKKSLIAEMALIS